MLLCLPLNITYNAAYFTDCVVLQSSGGFAKGLDFNQRLVKQVKEGKIDELIKKYGVNWVVIAIKNEYNILGKEVFSAGNVKVIRIT